MTRATITANAVNLRSGPGTSFKALGQVYTGASGEMLETHASCDPGTPDTWHRIRFDPEGHEAWVYSLYVRIEDTVAAPGGASGSMTAATTTVTWARWDAPIAYRSISNGFTPDHRGIDYAAPEGTPVFCGPMGGKVVKVGFCRACGVEGISSLSKGYVLNDSRVWGNADWEGGFGHNVVVEYPYDILPNEAREFLKGRGWEGYNAYVLYGHLRTITVEPGQDLTVKTQIGTVGNSGNSNGPHLHGELKFGQNFRHGFAGLERGLSNPSLLFGR